MKYTWYALAIHSKYRFPTDSAPGYVFLWIPTARATTPSNWFVWFEGIKGERIHRRSQKSSTSTLYLSGFLSLLMDNPGSSSPHSRSPTDTSHQTSSSQTSCQHNDGARNLVVCIDGTSNQFGQNNTNIVKLFADLNEGSEMSHPEQTHLPKQHAYYSSGIGTSPKSLPMFSRVEKAVTDKVGMAIAWNMEEIVKDAYGWLAQRYEEGDRIFLFGFSRGAYQVRVLAAMIHEVGLIKTATEKQIGIAYDHYEDMQSGRAKARQIAREFKKTFSWKKLRVHFVGVWDTVSSVGLVKADIFLSTSSSAAHACHFRHALALDERRVKFMPEYFREMNSLPDDRNSNCGEPAVSDSTASTASSREQNSTIPDVKEVWFAGSHSDVGGKNRPGNSHQAGNVSLLWMRREAAEHGLVLKPTDMVWVPDDLDFGISDSMNYGWRAIEYCPVRHQVSFSGAGKNERRLHRAQPRRIIPGQKVHASILYSNAYRPQATLGDGFDMPIILPGLEDTPLDPSIWETELFDNTAARQLLERLGGTQGVAPIYLDRLLFMLRFGEGRERVRKVDGSKPKLKDLMTKPGCPALVKLVTIVAYYEAFCEADAQTQCMPLHEELPEGIFQDAMVALQDVLRADKHPDGPRVVALLAPLTRHQILREKLLNPETLSILVRLLDKTVENVKQSGMNFGLAMNGLTYLLQSKDTRKTMFEKLAEFSPDSTRGMSRLSRILDVNDSHLSTVAVLRMVLTLARFPEAKELCISVKPRLRELAKKAVGPVGSLAVEILLVLYDPNEQQTPNEQEQLDIRNANVRANLANVLVRLNPNIQGSGDSSANLQVHLASPLVRLKHGGRDSSDGSGDNVDPGQETLRRLFGLNAPTLKSEQKKFILELKLAIQHGSTRERTASTMTVLKLFESKVIREYLRGIKLLDTFIEQLKRNGSALLAAYALAICLTYDDMTSSIMDNDNLPKNIVGMLREDYFDDAVGQVEGFDIFRSFMQHEELRKKIEKYPIADILNEKLGGQKPKEIRTSLICLDIFRSFNTQEGWSHELVVKSLKHLRKSTWGEQKAGVTILSALAQTEHGVAVIEPQILKIVEMLLPPDYRLRAPSEASAASATSSTKRQSIEASTESAGLRSPTDGVPKADTTPPKSNSPIEVVAGTSAATSPSEPQSQPVVTISESAGPRSRTSSNVAHKAHMILKKTLPVPQVFSRKFTATSVNESEEPWPRPLPWMMGPACALRVLVRNRKLRDTLRQSLQYSSLKNLHLTGALVYRKDTSSLRINTPNRTDVIYMLDKLIKIVDEDPEDEGFKSIEDAVLPHIRHWNRLVTLLGDRTITTLSVIPAVLGISTFGVLALLVAVPIYVPRRAYKFSKRVVARIRTVHNMLRSGDNGPTGQREHAGGEAHLIAAAGVEATSAHGEASQDVETIGMGMLRDGNAEEMIATS
ncbi:hypothetical protein JVU11DRAFT_10740 [Chiua virens]|nr:hypothetical protein JVU11DRAFT_10740 [Chiua virens]